MPTRHRVAIIGAGLAGLVAAYHLTIRGINVTLFEKDTHCGGRIRNNSIDRTTAPVGAIMFTPDYSEYLKLVDSLDSLTGSSGSLSL